VSVVEVVLWVGSLETVEQDTATPNS